MTTVRKYISSSLSNRERERERERDRQTERERERERERESLYSNSNFARQITVNPARIPLRESKIHCYSNITYDSSYKTKRTVSTQSRKNMP